MGLSRVLVRLSMPVGLLAYCVAGVDWAQQPPTPPAEARLDRASVKQFATQYCVNCHNAEDKKGGLALDVIGDKSIADHPAIWEKVVRKLTTRQMPPTGRQRPDENTYDLVVASLEIELDRLAAAKPNPGRTPTLRRLNRTEYQNAIHD